MAYKTHPINVLTQFLPEGSYPLVKSYLDNYPIHLSVKKERKTVYGDYRPPVHGEVMHRISVNGNLNPQHFLITLIHEIAHMLVYIHVPHKVSPHGKEWKQTFQKTMQPFMNNEIFTSNVLNALESFMSNPGASSCSDPQLLKVISSYDQQADDFVYVEELEMHSWFCIDKGDHFQRLQKQRTRYQCRRKSDGRLFLFPALMKVRKLATME